jgi:hypothetical protein
MNLKKLRRARLERPTDYVPVPELAALMFDVGEVPRLKVRGLSANEIFLIKEQIQKGSPLQALAKAATTNGHGNSSELTQAFQQLLGTDPKAVAHENRYRQELLVKAVIDEEGQSILDHQDAARLSEFFPMAFLRLTDRIQTLMGEASTDLGEKSRHSGETPALDPPSPSESDSISASSKSDPTSSPSDD